jgi:predicted nicotinamide N-methyase
MLVSLDLDNTDDDDIVATYDVAGTLIVIKSKPAVARGAGEDGGGDGGNGDGGGGNDDRDREAKQVVSPTQAKYANVGLVLWQAGLVAADWIIRRQRRRQQEDEGPLPPSSSLPPLGARVVELGCGVGQCGIALAAAGVARRVVMTDLAHIVLLAEENVRLNAGALSSGGRRPPVAMAYVWGDDAAPVLAALREPGADAAAGADLAAATTTAAPEAATTTTRTAAPAAAAAAATTIAAPPEPPWPDLVVAADCLYEPRVYPLLLSALERLCGPRTLCVMCHRMRVYGEGAFEASARGAGFDVRGAPAGELHPEYACGGWRLVELRRRAAGGGA